MYKTTNKTCANKQTPSCISFRKKAQRNRGIYLRLENESEYFSKFKLLKKTRNDLVTREALIKNKLQIGSGIINASETIRKALIAIRVLNTKELVGPIDVKLH